MKALLVKPFYPRWMILVALKARCDVREINGPSDCICSITILQLLLYFCSSYSFNTFLWYQSFDNLGDNQALKNVKYLFNGAIIMVNQ